jgi:hypothetical protein
LVVHQYVRHNLSSAAAAVEESPCLAKIFRQVRLAPNAVFSHRVEGAPRSIVEHRLVGAAEAVLDTGGEGAIHLTTTLRAKQLLGLGVRANEEIRDELLSGTALAPILPED